MKRSEVGVVLMAAFVAVAAGVVVVTAGTWLSRSIDFNVGANVIQWTSGPGTFGVVVMALWMRWSRRCAVPLCMRHGEHPVDGTLKKVCTIHHTREHHALIRDLHTEAHRLSGRLDWGRSRDAG